MFDIADEIIELSTKAHDNKLSGNDRSDGSISISNIGSVGGAHFTPIINHPESAIVGVGIISDKPVVNNEGEIVVSKVLSTNTASSIPRDTASIPKAPLPAYKSNTFPPEKYGPIILNMVSSNLSPVGLVLRPGKLSKLRPP